MRRALGLTGDRAGRSSLPQAERPRADPPGRIAGRSSSDKPRHRFVQDGTAPVTVLNRHRPDEADGLSASRAAIELTLQDERAARAKAERSLQDALATVHDLQTKLGHAELAHREVLTAAQAALAEFERELIVERTRAGLASARARGRNGGRPFKMTAAKFRLAQAAMGQPGTKVGELCTELGVSRQTLCRHVDLTGVLRPDGKRLLGRSTRRPHQMLNPVQIGA